MLGAVVAFGLTVRPGGLVVAAPLAIVVGACGSRDVRWGETIGFGVGAVMAARPDLVAGAPARRPDHRAVPAVAGAPGGG